jgi:hypothetical protein
MYMGGARTKREAHLMTTDTTPAAQKRQHEIFKRMSGERKLLLAMAFDDQIRDIALEELRRRHPSASEEALKVTFIKEIYGVAMPQRLGDPHHE